MGRGLKPYMYGVTPGKTYTLKYIVVRMTDTDANANAITISYSFNINNQNPNVTDY